MDTQPAYTGEDEGGWLGRTISPAYVGEPEGDGVIERFRWTRKAQCLYLHQFASLDEARRVIGAFIHRYITEWLIARLRYRTPAATRNAAWGRVMRLNPSPGNRELYIASVKQ